MSLIETAPQKHKSYNEKQDHGDAAERKGHHKAVHDNGIQRKVFAKVEDDQFKQAIADAEADYYSMDSAALEAEADKILGETSQDLELPALLKASDEILKAVADSVDAAEASSLIEEYRDVYVERQEILDRIDGESNETALELTALEQSLREHLESIEEDLIDIVNSQDTFPTEAEYGVRSKREIRDKLARLATEDSDYTEDDDGDPDYGSAIRIKNRL